MSRRYAVHLDTFSGRIAQLSKAQHRDKKLVLRALSTDPMVSTWDMGESRNLQRTIKALETDNLIVSHEQPYPWHRFVVTEEGKKYMEAE